MRESNLVSPAGLPPQEAGPSAPVAELRSITKRFGSVVALDNVSLELTRGEIHALLGENGAGKTTLMNILCGLVPADSGQILLDGRRVSIDSPRDAIDLGIGMVHQHYRLVSKLTAAENLHLGWGETPLRLSRRTLEERTRMYAEKFNLQFNPRVPVWQLSIGEQQRLAILRTLVRGARILILDEPTAVLTPSEVRSLFQLLRRLASQKRTIVFISHKLEEVLDISDSITVLRAARKVDSLPRSECDTRSLAQMMIGRRYLPSGRAQGHAKPERTLQVQAVSALDDRGHQTLRDISFALHRGEILGIAGVAGNGQRELSEVLTGMRPLLSGHIHSEGQDLSHADSRDFVRAGIGHIPEDRLGTGLIPAEPLDRNVILREFRRKPIRRGPFLIASEIARFAQRVLQKARFAAFQPKKPLRHLSGGYAQRLLTARELMTTTRVLVSVHPTYGLDVAAAEEIRQAHIAAAAQGTSIILISEDLEDLLHLSDRILVLYNGEVIGQFAAEDFDSEEIGLLMGGADERRSKRER